MTRAQFLELLAFLLREKRITPLQAKDALTAFDAGDIEGAFLPLPADAAIQDIDRSSGRNAVLALIALLLARNLRRDAGRLATMLRRPNAPRVRIVLDSRRFLRDRLRGGFERRMYELGQQVARTGNIARWQTGMQIEVRDYMTRQYAAGLGRPLTPADLGRLNTQIRTQQAYLHRYAGELSVRQAAGTPYSQAYIINRSQSYGAGWEQWFRGNEAAITGDGFVVYYISVDSPSTCGPCLDAQRGGPYLPGQGPFPGAPTCQGLNRCRCRREERYDPAAWEGLTGRPLVQAA